jgi:outer membrane transport energization protein ExbD (TC 2.C.1.1.1)
MAFGSFDRGQGSAPMAEINVVPLVDIMLVLLVIFIVTAPLLSHAVKIDLPKASSAPVEVRTPPVQIAIDGQGQRFWADQPVSRADLRQRLAAAARRRPRPELHIRADRHTDYQALAELMSDAAKVGLDRIGFVTEPAATEGNGGPRR